MRISYLPVALCAEVVPFSKFQKGAVDEDLYRGEATEPIRDVVFEIAKAAKDHLDLARRCPHSCCQVNSPARALFQTKPTWPFVNQYVRGADS